MKVEIFRWCIFEVDLTRDTLLLRVLRRHLAPQLLEISNKILDLTKTITNLKQMRPSRRLLVPLYLYSMGANSVPILAYCGPALGVR